MDDLAKKLYRSYAFGEELDDGWSEAVLQTSRAKRVPLDRLIEDLAKDAEAMIEVADRWSEVPSELPKAA